MANRKDSRTVDELIESLGSNQGARRKLSAEGLKLVERLERETRSDSRGGGESEKPADVDPPVAAPDAPSPAAPPPKPSPSSEPAPKPGGHPKDGQGHGCCEAITVRLEYIKIEELTHPRQFKDNVVITGLSQGEVMNPSPMQFAWPLDRDGEIDSRDMDKGDEERPNNLVARAKVGRDCMVSLECEIKFWEEDASEIGELLKEAAQMLSALLAAQQGMTMPASTTGLIRKVMKEIAKKLGLTDDAMGAYNFKVSGQLHCDTDIAQLTWEPPWGSGGYAHERVDQRTARLSRTFGMNGGRWKTSLLVQMICPNCD